MSCTKEGWKVEGTTVYALESDGFLGGREVFRNRFSALVQGYRNTPQEELEANARLMAAAPDLLSALQELLSEVGDTYACPQDVALKADKAIKKALGE